MGVGSVHACMPWVILLDEMDEADMETNLSSEEVEENANTNEINDHSGKERIETCM